jgi:hypothetical protein
MDVDPKAFQNAFKILSKDARVRGCPRPYLLHPLIPKGFDNLFKE